MPDPLVSVSSPSRSVPIRPDLGAAGVVALMTPAENPTAEPELSVLADPDVSLLTTRMYSTDPDMGRRLVDYATGAARWMEPLGAAPLDAVVFACTGSSYLAGAARAPGRVIDHGGRSLPLIAAAHALEEALAALAARRLAIVTPYPQALTRAAVDWWTGRGFEIASVTEVPPADGGHPIYARDAAAILATLRGASGAPGDVVVALGTGAPSLPALAVASLENARPMLSSNLATGWALSRVLSAAPAETARDSLAAWLAADAPWRARLAIRFPRLMARLS